VSKQEQITSIPKARRWPPFSPSKTQSAESGKVSHGQVFCDLW